MKNTLVVFSLFVMCLCTSGIHQVKAQELLLNGGFETWTDGLPDNWSAETQVTLLQEATIVHEGAYSIGMAATTTSNRGIYQVVAIVPGTFYEYSVYIYGATGAGNIGLYINWLDAGGAVIGGAGTYYNTIAGEWERVTSGPLEAPANAASARVRIRCYSDTTLGGYSDHASFVQATTPDTATPSPTASATTPTATPGPHADIKINEVHINTPGTDHGCFVELYFPEGTSLDGYSLVGVNGNNNLEYNIIALDGYAIPADGFFVIAQDDTVLTADLISTLVDYQNGPDNIQLRYMGTIVDAIGYGTFSASEYFAGEGTAVPLVLDSQSYSRIPDGNDTNDNAVDFLPGELTAGSANIQTAPTPTGIPTTPSTPTPVPTDTPTAPTPTPGPHFDIKINEVYINSVGTDHGCYIELFYSGGCSLDGYTLVGVNGYNNLDYNSIPLDGYAIPSDGFFVIAQDDTVLTADMISTLVDYQNGPDNIQLRYMGATIDAIGYGTFDADEYFAGEGTAVPLVLDSQSYSRIPDGNDTGNNLVDFLAGELTAGSPNIEVPPTTTPTTPTPTPTGSSPTSTPTPGLYLEIKINEVYINPPGTDLGCYVELYFAGGASLDGYSLVGVNGYNDQDYNSIPLDGYAIPADGFFVIAQDASVLEADLISASVDYQNGPDNIQLRYQGAVVDAIGYGTFTAGDYFAGEGTAVPTSILIGTQSFSRSPDGMDTNDNVVDFMAGELTAGFENSLEATPTPTPSPTPTGTECINDGDANLDGSVTAGDAQRSFEIALSVYIPNEIERCAADCNGDGSVTAGDAQGIFYKALSLGDCVDP